MVNITRISDTHAVIENYKKLKLHELEKLGYRLSGRRIPLGTKPYRFGIMEVQNEDKKGGLVTFSYLYSIIEEYGVILPYGYDYYLTHNLV